MALAAAVAAVAGMPFSGSEPEALATAWSVIGVVPSRLFLPGTFGSLITALALNYLVALTLIFINKRYNFLRSLSLLFAGMFLVMEAALPTLIDTLSGGIVMAGIVMLAMAALFSAFQRPDRTRRVFLAFCLVSAGGLIDIASVAFLIPFILGCFQMRCATPQSLTAALLGIITPWWMAWGFGALPLSDLTIPPLVSIFSGLDTTQIAQVVVYAVTSVTLGLGLGAVNLLRIYSYNANARAYNGFLTLLSITSVLLMLIDYHRMVLYLPMVNICAAIQVGHFFVINNRKRSYIAILCIIAIYVALYLWSIAS